MRNYLFIILLFCFCSKGNTDSTSTKNVTYTVDTLATITFNNEQCLACINANEEFPYDFTIDAEKNVYLIEAGLQNIRKIDFEGKTVWNLSTAPIQHSAIHYYKEKIYAFDGITLEIRNTKTGVAENKFKLPISRDSLFLGDNIYFYENYLYVNYRCPEMGRVNAYSVLLFDIDNGKMQKRANCVNYGYANKDKNSSTFWATPDCPDCFKNLSELGSNNLEGQSSRYIIIGIPNKDPGDKADTRLLVYDKQSQQKVITDLDKYYSEPAGSKRFKFLSPTVAVTTQVEYKDGMPNILRLLSIKFGD